MAKRLKNYVNGQWVEPNAKDYLDIENPSTGQVLAQVPLTPAADVAQAIDAAAAAFPSWSQTPVARRVQPIYELASLLRKNEDKIVIERYWTEDPQLVSAS